MLMVTRVLLTLGGPNSGQGYNSVETCKDALEFEELLVSFFPAPTQGRNSGCQLRNVKFHRYENQTVLTPFSWTRCSFTHDIRSVIMQEPGNTHCREQIEITFAMYKESILKG
ncbi:hypothetical protein Droror1_Dr00001191 [Drosera rotundifolia]